MVEQPSGTVTFVFTDIEGSTRLLREFGEEKYGSALAAHRDVVRDALGERGGYEVDYEGDAFFYAFASAVDAVAAVAEAMSRLEPSPVRLRVGVHTGTPALDPPKYLGLDIHLAARVGAAGHGGQVLLTRATRELVGGPMLDLGEHRLKDFDEPVSLFQLGTERFPELKTISNTNLPRPVSSFVGRAREQEELAALLRDGSRLVTLSGPGGSGKTRLAIEVASELVTAFKAGVSWVGLAPLRDPLLVPETIAQTLGAKDGLERHIGDRELLLVLDNFEQVVEASPELGTLLEGCPNLKLLVTSRERLRIRGEVEYPVPPLAESDAVELFCERSGLEAEGEIAELCHRLEELPLALELAATRTTVLSVSQILERLGQRLDLLKAGRDAEARQQTLRATIEWSYELLSREEQALFRRLSVFRGGCSLEAAEQVAGAELDLLQSLVDKNLLRHGGERFSMLETIREYAFEQLNTRVEDADARERHSHFFLAFIELAAPGLDEGRGRDDECARVRREHDNLRAALEWADESRDDEMLLRLAAGLASFLWLLGYYQEMKRWLPLALDRAKFPAQARMRVLRTASSQAWEEGDMSRLATLVAERRSLAEQEGDERELLQAIGSEAMLARQLGDLDHARTLELARVEQASLSGDRLMEAHATLNLADVASREGDLETCLDLALRCVSFFRELGHEEGVADGLAICGWACLNLSDPRGAADYFRQSLAILTRNGAIRTYVGGALLALLGVALVALENAEDGAQLIGAGVAIRDEIGGLWDEDDEQSVDEAIAAAKASLGETAFAVAWARGAAMAPEELIAFATALPA
ncbi:MAG TPA: adenylate/guanylate cyclase domain-containing protein [Gaiellaceae bacterium]|nr:adenylate/guanylate cyclase domain-containing protein [Gaiellaceae bacterium]